MNVSEMTGADLDYWTARAEGIPARQLKIRKVHNYSEDWAQGGALIAKHCMYVEWDADGYWCAHTDKGGTVFGMTALEAICRAVVHAKFGNEVN